MPLPKGSILVHDGEKIVGITPSEDGDTFEYDSTTPSGIKPVAKNTKKIVKLNKTRSNITSSGSYDALYEFVFPGGDVSSISSIKFLSYMDNGITSYDIRIYDSTNGTVIATVNLTNAVKTIITLSSFNNIPTGDAIMEIQAKKNGGSGNKSIYLDDINIIYS